jgi:hypothetical protein
MKRKELWERGYNLHSLHGKTIKEIRWFEGNTCEKIVIETTDGEEFEIYSDNASHSNDTELTIHINKEV